MSSGASASIESVGELLAHALELEHDSAEGYRELARSMAVHHNQVIADLFEHLAALSDAHAREVADRARGVRLPEIAPWDFKWNCPGSPESPVPDGSVSYLMTAVQALGLALEYERRGRDFYACVAGDSPDPEVRRLAGEMAEEEDAHIELLLGWLTRESQTDQLPLEDLDPPNMPE